MALDFIRREDVRDFKAPVLHGHVKIKTYYAKSGNLAEVVEGDNLVTNALADIFKNNYLGSLNYGSQMPIWSKWYGGILCYANAHTIDADNYFMPSEDSNAVIAHAGNEAPGTAEIIQQDLKRGSPLQITQTSNSVTQIWEWGSEQGNCGAGVDISAISLCHVDVGNAGTGSTSDKFKALNPFESIGSVPNATISVAAPDNAFCQYDVNHQLWFHPGEPSDYYNGHTSFSTTKLTVIKRRLPYSKVGLYETMIAETTYPESFTVTLTTFSLYNQPSYYFDYTNKKLWIFSNLTGATDGNTRQTYDSETVHYAVIDCENETIDSEGAIVSDTADLAPTSMEMYPNRSIAYNPSRMRNANIIKDGNYVYLPMTDGVVWGNYQSEGVSKFNVKALKRINIVNQAEQTTVSFNEVQQQFKSSMFGGGIIINSGRVINGSTGYTCASPLSEAEAIPCYACHEPYNPSSLVTYLGAGGDSGSQARYIMANKFLNTTLYNLGTPVHKTTAKSMQISYTLTEV